MEDSIENTKQNHLLKILPTILKINLIKNVHIELIFIKTLKQYLFQWLYVG